MNIPATSVTSHHVRAAELPNALRVSDRPDKPGTHSRDTARVDRPTVDAREEDGDASTEVREDGKGRGVLRLLEGGQFKGVADVRLRINFFDELSSRAGASALPAVEEQAGEVVSAVEARVDELIDTLELGDETLGLVSDAVAVFDEAVRTLAGQVISAGRVDPDALASEIQLAFEGLVEQLDALLVNPTSEPEQPSSTANAPDEAFASIRNAFDDALATLISSLNQAVRLPDPTSPTGQGQAYAKFLAIYDGLRSTPHAVDATV